jgi:hypothetical protein
MTYLAVPLERLFAQGIGLMREALTVLAPKY